MDNTIKMLESKGMGIDDLEQFLIELSMAVSEDRGDTRIINGLQSARVLLIQDLRQLTNQAEPGG